MKPIVNDKKCGASESACKAIKICPVGAIGYAEADEPIADRNVNCDCACGCACGDNTKDCGGSPYGRIIIDYDKCTECGLCIKECCGAAIETEEK